MTNKIEKDIIKNLDTSKNYVVALSGGVDSAVLATIVAQQTPNLRSVFVRPVSYTHLTLPTKRIV